MHRPFPLCFPPRQRRSLQGFSLPLVYVLAGASLVAPAPGRVPSEPDAATASAEGTLSFSASQAFVNGHTAGFQERFQKKAGGSGGIQKFRYWREDQQNSLSIEGHFLPGDDDHRFSGRLERTDSGLYSRFGYNSHRVFYDGAGGYFGPADLVVRLYDERLHIDRGNLWIEVGFAAEDRPHVFLRYERLSRQGKKPSTELGETNLTGGLGSRAIIPASMDIDEIRHLLVAEASRNLDPARWGAGARYERSEQHNARHTARRPGEPAASRVATTRDSVDTDLFSTHAFVDLEFGEKLRASAGALVAAIDTTLDGSRIYGDSSNPVFDPGFARRQATDLGFLDLSGGSRLKQHVFNLNAVYLPKKAWAVRPGLRYEHLQTDSLATFTATSVQNNLSTLQQETAAQTQKQENRLTETVEVRYTGHPRRTYVLRGEWNQASGDLDELQVLRETGGSSLDRRTDYTRHLQKYAFSASWYTRPRLTLSSEYYYKSQTNRYDAVRDSTPSNSADRYPAFITCQGFEVHDVNVRASWRPASTLSLVTRYDLQFASSTTGFAGLQEMRNGRTTAHIVSQSCTWSPLPRLYVSGSGNLVYDQLATSAASAVNQNSDNNYLNASLGAGYALGKKTDLHADLTHYRARNFADNFAVSLPYGTNQEISSASLTCTVRRSENVVYTFKYTYAMSRDDASGGRNDYHAGLLYGKMQYHF